MSDEPKSKDKIAQAMREIAAMSAADLRRLARCWRDQKRDGKRSFLDDMAASSLEWMAQQRDAKGGRP